MLSVAVAASPERCVAALQAKRGQRGGSAVSVAAHMEVLEDNGDMQVWGWVVWCGVGVGCGVGCGVWGVGFGVALGGEGVWGGVGWDLG